MYNFMYVRYLGEGMVENYSLYLKQQEVAGSLSF